MTTLKLLISIINLFSLTASKDVLFDFNEILKQDRKILKEEHFLGDTSKIKLFNNLTKPELSYFKHVTKYNGNHRIDIWTKKDSKVFKIVKVSTKIPVDTVLYRNEINGKKTISKKINATFEFITYQFSQRQAPNKLTYLSIKNLGLSEYSVENKKYYISYESTFVGMNLVYLKTKNEIMKILNEI